MLKITHQDKMETIQNIQEELQNILSPKRYIHSIGVMKMAQKLAKHYCLDEQTAALTGLVHDIAKELTKEQSMEYIQQNHIEIDQIEKYNHKLLHAKIGAHMAKQKYQFNESMEKAIRYHTTASVHMDKLAKIIYIADKIEENRNYEQVENLRQLALEDLDKTMLTILDFTTKENIDKGKLLHPDGINARNALLLKNN